MAGLKEITAYLDGLLDLERFGADSSNNGLQVEGSPVVEKIVFGVDACLELFELAIEADADMVFTHHGLSWGGGFQRVTGIDAARFAALFANGISLYSAHLPLDAHPRVGHNAVIAEKLGLLERRSFAEYAGVEIGVAGKLEKPLSAAELADELKNKLGFDDISILGGGNGEKIETVGVVSGGAGSDGVIAAAGEGLDCLVTGEMGHASWHVVRESGVAVLAAGHYATEKPGVLAVMDGIAAEFDVETLFVDIPTGL